MKKIILTLLIIFMLSLTYLSVSNDKTNEYDSNYIMGLAAASSSDANKDGTEASSSKPKESLGSSKASSQKENSSTTEPSDNNSSVATDTTKVDECDVDNGKNCDKCTDDIDAASCRRTCTSITMYGACDAECTYTYKDGSTTHYLNSESCVSCVNPICGTSHQDQGDLRDKDEPKKYNVPDDPKESETFTGFDFCTNSNVLRGLDIIHTLFTIVRIVVPLILIILASIDFGKAVISSDENALKNAISTVTRRLIVCLIIFFVPTIIYSIIHLIDKSKDDDSTFKYCDICLTGRDQNGNSAKCEYDVTYKPL